MEEPDTPKEVNQIQTFVFLDMESTGLPKDSPRITELSLIAVSRAHLLEMKESSVAGSTSKVANGQPSTHHTSATHMASGSSAGAAEQKKKVIPKLPRVLHKYTRLYYPWKVIPSITQDITGLSNEALEHLPPFTEASAEALNLFLDLPKPVSIVAHNGNRFDFPLLMAELGRVNSGDKFLNLLCVDTLIAIKDIDALIEREDIQEITKAADSFNINDFEDDPPEEAFMEEAFNPSKRPRPGESDEEGCSPISNTPPSPYESASPGHDNNHHTMEACAEPLLTPMKSHQSGQTSIPATPSKSSQPPPLPCTPESSQQSTPGTPGTPCLSAKVTKESSKVRRTLTYERNGKRRRNQRMPYKQLNIYNRLFDSNYVAHRAEEDCMALLTICGHYGSKFVEWSDTFATSFANVKPMWVKKKSFHVSQEG